MSRYRDAEFEAAAALAQTAAQTTAKTAAKAPAPNIPVIGLAQRQGLVAALDEASRLVTAQRAGRKVRHDRDQLAQVLVLLGTVHDALAEGLPPPAPASAGKRARR